MSLLDNVNPNCFPAKLWRLVNRPSTSAIYWDVSGDIVVIEQHQFETQFLSPLWSSAHDADGFRTSNFSSFVRQLNLYGFRKVKDGASVRGIRNPKDKGSVHCFHNPNFNRNRPELLVNLRRLTVKHKAKMEAGLEVCSQLPIRFDPGYGGRDTHQKSIGASALGIPVMSHIRTSTPRQYLVNSHSVVASLNHHYPCTVSSHLHQPMPLKYRAFHPRSTWLCVCPVCQISQTAPSFPPFPLGSHCPRPLPPPGYSQVLSPLNKQMNCDVNLDTVFKMADEMIEMSVPRRVVQVQTPDKPTQSGPRVMMSQTGADKDIRALLISGVDFLSCSDEEKSVVQVPEQVPEDAICEMDSERKLVVVTDEEEEEDKEEEAVEEEDLFFRQDDEVGNL